ncbi:MAG: 6,7-dimethyl-8-ribityllumazine synthase [Flavobacteriales bacterium]|jgi:6,7-dimethyl-8-ribityllumazine synthase|nr:6,7-dimethyl-8-ribityllumazine synthase [Flavobacteriales bacterium]MBK6549474.1 6,7-dimethyl-8-ribityllumazine synthase [Flavobacteriales bacterium]MBK6883939.1 6,7-dimethyl-8-ribityllumazine synthase [Flavobacteriales bacterium]MBK7100330.1 6,7-dimethyl-8-ribityllumazine synthase [Flavobacteriales bacterium]MBK7111024.1 6,7-dimethyl-8-ribityllumazine synthase [Flavobacteriales bacterium]
MATASHNLSTYDPTSVPSGAGRRFALVVSEWNLEITDALRTGAKETLMKHGVAPEDILETWVPGSFELALGAQILLETETLDGVICLGSVVRGETPHFDFVCQGTAQGIMSVGLKFGRPVIFGVLTDNTMEQARDRSGGKHGNKGVDCAVAVLKMAALKG